jgi:hypothetical protein
VWNSDIIQEPIASMKPEVKLMSEMSANNWPNLKRLMAEERKFWYRLRIQTVQFHVHSHVLKRRNIFYKIIFQEECRGNYRKRLRFRSAMRVSFDVIDSLAYACCMEHKFNKSCKYLNVDILAHILVVSLLDASINEAWNILLHKS